jgi:hypothetical protein
LPSAFFLAICLGSLAYYAARKVTWDVPPVELSEVTGQAYIGDDGSIILNIYNGSKFVLTEITVSISVFLPDFIPDPPTGYYAVPAPRQWQEPVPKNPVGKLTPVPSGAAPSRTAVISNRAYRLFSPFSGSLSPQSSGKFSADLGFTLAPYQTWEFSIVAAKGRPE